MRRADGRWIPDGRAKTIRADCEASLAALDGLEIDLYLIHAPDPRDAVEDLGARARAARRRGPRQARRRCRTSTGGSWTRRSSSPRSRQSRSRSASSTTARVRGGVVERCDEHGHRADRALAARRAARRSRPPRCGRGPGRGARSPGCSSSPPPSSRFPALAARRRPARPRAPRSSVSTPSEPGPHSASSKPTARRARRRGDGDIVVVMGIPGAGKSRVAAEYVARGYVRLNRDERGGTLRDIAAALDEQLSSGMRNVVLDNTYLTRATRSHVIEAAARHGVAARCIWLDTPLAQAQVNLVERLLERFGHLPTPEELRALGRRRAGPARSHVADASAPRARAAGRGRGLRQRRADRVRTGFNRRAGARGVFVAAAAVEHAPRLETLRTLCSTGCPAAGPMRSQTLSADSPTGFRGRWKAQSAHIPAARPSAGAGRRCQGCCSRSREHTASIRPARRSSERAQRTRRWRRPSAPATCRSDERSTRARRPLRRAASECRSPPSPRPVAGARTRPGRLRSSRARLPCRPNGFSREATRSRITSSGALSSTTASNRRIELALVGDGARRRTTRRRHAR